MKLPENFSQGARIFACFICSKVWCRSILACTTAEVSFNIFTKARTSSRFESAPCPGITFTSAGNIVIAFSMALIMPWTLPPGGHIDKRKSVAHKIIAHVHNVVLREENDRVAVGVTGGKMQRANVFAIQVHAHVVLNSDDRQRRFRRRFDFGLNRTAIGTDAGDATAFQSLAHIVLGNHRGTRVAERLVPAGVITVIVSVDDKPHGFVGNALESGLNLFRKRRELIINDNDAVFTYRGRYVAARALEHVDVSRYFSYFDLNLREIILLRYR